MTAPHRFPDGCVREELVLVSRVLGRDLPVCVLLPPGAENLGRLPVLHALHGKDALCTAFSEMKPLREYLADHPMAIVAFQADQDSCYIDALRRKQSLFTTFFFEELVPEIAARHPVSAERAVTGFSMGGYGAFHYLLTRPGEFSSVSAMSGAFDLFENEEGDKTREGRRPWLEELVGLRTETPAAWEAARLEPRLRDLASRGVPLPPLLMLCGTEDSLKETSRRFVDLLAAINAGLPTPPIRFEYRESPGAHNWPYWRDHIVPIAEFHWQNFTHKDPGPSLSAHP